jgi:SSS family transporter
MSLQIQPLDLLLLVLYLGGTVWLGVWLGRGQQSTRDYLLGNHSLPWWALLISIVATETSTATFLSVPGIAYGNGLPGTTGDLRFLQLPLGYIVGRSIAAYLLLPLYFQREMFTAYDVLRVRSGPAVRTLASGLFLVTRTLADGLRLYLTALVVQVICGWPLPACVLLVGLTTLIYTAVGGMRAVVWTDVIQFFVYVAGALAAAVVLSQSLTDATGQGTGLQTVLAQAAAEGRLRLFDFSVDLSNPFTFWAGVIGGAVLSVGSHGVDQLIVQRYLSASSLADARKALLISGPLVLLQFALFLVIGLGLHDYYLQHPPASPFTRSDAVFVDFIVHHLPTGLVGLVLGGTLAAAMSTLSSSLNASASALLTDFILPVTGGSADDPRALRMARAATVLFAALQIAVGVSGLGGANAVVSSVLSVATVTTGVILGLFLLALSPRRHPAASLLGLVAGIAATMVVVFGLPLLDIRLAWPWYGVVSCGVTSAVGALAARLITVGTRDERARGDRTGPV